VTGSGSSVPGASKPSAPPGAVWRANPAFTRLCAAVVVSELGDWLLFIALPLYVLGESGSALDTSTVFLAELVPAVVIGTACGPVIDRRDPGRLLAALTGLQTVILVPLLWAGPGRVWVVYVVAGAQSALTSITIPCQQAVVPLLVESQDISRANAGVQVASNAARLIGSPVGGALLPVLGLRGLVIADMASFLVSATLLAGSARHTSRPKTRPPTGRVAAVAEGWHAVRRSTTLRFAVIVAFAGSVAQGLFLVLFVLFVLRSLHAGDSVVGLLRGVQAIGGVLGGLLIATWARRASARALTVWGLWAFALVSLLTWNSPRFTTATWWYVALFIAVGTPGTALATGLITGTQEAAPSPVLGRVVSLIQVAEALGQGAGILAAGLLSSLTSLTVLLNAQGGCYLTCAMVAMIGFARKLPRPVGPRDATLTHPRPPASDIA
jgi:MFS family permease